MRQYPVKFKAPSIILFFVIFSNKILISSSTLLVNLLVVFWELLMKYLVWYIKAAENVHHFCDFWGYVGVTLTAFLNTHILVLEDRMSKHTGYAHRTWLGFISNS